MNILKRAVYYLWILLVLALVIQVYRNPEIATSEYIQDLLTSYSGNYILIIYIIISFGRGFFLIPSTPFVIAGGILFPDQLFLVVIISMIGILASSSALYFFSDLLGYSVYLEKKFPTKIEIWKQRLKRPSAIYVVIAWSLFPFVPTDLICYVSGIVKMPYRNMIVGVFLGEIILVTLYVYFGANVLNVFS